MCRPRGGQEGFALLPSLGALCFHLLFPSQNNPHPPETASSDQKRTARMKKKRRMPRWRFLAPRERRVDGWMDRCGWDGGERVDAIGEERPLSRSTRTPCQPVHLSMLPSSAEIACRTLWSRDGKEHWPCDLPSNGMAVAHLGWVASVVDHGDGDKGEDGTCAPPRI